MATKTTNRGDIYTQVTNRIVEELERGVRPWLKPWNAEHAAGRIDKLPIVNLFVLLAFGIQVVNAIPTALPRGSTRS